ncbi:MAG: hypothetical protein AAF518_01380 [Spirochaetota bacterium]
MNSPTLPGYLTVSLFAIELCSLEEFLQAPADMLADEYAYYAGNLKQQNSYATDKTLRKTELKQKNIWQQRWLRLQALAEHCYKYELSYSTQSLGQLTNIEEETPERMLVLQSQNLPEDFLELVRIFHLNSFLYQRNSSPRFVDQMYFKAGYISQNKLQRMLEGKGRGVYSETFQILRPVLDRDFASNVDSISGRHYLEG